MRRVVVAILVIVIVIIGVFGLLFLGSLFGAGFNADMQVVWLNENGDPVGGFGFVNPVGDPVVDVKTDISWTLTSSSGAPVEAPQVSGSLTITVRLNTIQGSLVNTITRGLLWTMKTTASWDEIFSVATLIGTPDQIGKDNGWVVTFALDLEGSGYLDGDKTTATDTASVSYKITWSTDTLLLNGVVEVGG